MKTIKFRAWDKWNKCWQIFILEDLIKGSSVIWDNFENWCQFIGLKDIEDKEIYEGDIEKSEHVVKWNQPECCFGWFNKNGTFINPVIGLGGIKKSGFKIIGNIYENPELLKQSR